MKVFLDANILLDVSNNKRVFHKFSVDTYNYLLTNAQIFTSCDLITTIYYINSKQDKKKHY